MKKKLLIITALVFTLGLALSVYAKGFSKLEAFSDLSKDKQTLIVETMKKNHEAKKELWSKMREAKKSMNDALTAPEFDAAAFQAGAEKVEQLKADMHQLKINSLKEIAPQLTQQERETLAVMFNRGKGGHGHHGSMCSK